MILIDCSSLSGPEQLHKRLAEALSFPAWYGHNLDALYDCLTEIHTPTVLCLHGCSPAAFPGFVETFRDAAGDNPLLSVLWD